MRRCFFRAAVLALGLMGFAGSSQAQAQDWTDYLHWPYSPPQYAPAGSPGAGLHDGFYLYPREQRIVPQIQGPYYRNFYGGKRILGMRHPHGWFHDWNKKKFYYGNHFMLDVF